MSVHSDLIFVRILLGAALVAGVSITGILLTIDTQLSIEYHHPEIA